jgi:hypothetical protein
VAGPNARAARISGVVFATAGAVVVLCGVASILTGVPSPARDLVPVNGPEDLVGRFVQFGPLLAAAAAALVAGTIAFLLGLRQLDVRAALIELIALGLAVDVCVGGAIGRVGYAPDGSVLPAAVLCLMGGSLMIAGGIVAVLGRG